MVSANIVQYIAAHFFPQEMHFVLIIDYMFQPYIIMIVHSVITGKCINHKAHKG